MVDNDWMPLIVLEGGWVLVEVVLGPLWRWEPAAAEDC